MLFRIYTGHKYLHIFPDDLIFPWEPEDLQHTHVALRDMPESLTLPRDKDAGRAVRGIGAKVLHRSHLVLVRVEVIEAVPQTADRQLLSF